MTSPDTAPSIEEQEDMLREAEKKRRARRRFDEGFAEYQHHLEEEAFSQIEEEELEDDLV